MGNADDKFSIIEVTNGIALFADLRDWDALKECFCDQVELFYPSGSVQLTSAALMENWKFLGEFAATQHLVTGHIVSLSGDRARCRARVHATHHMPSEKRDPYWICGGDYDYDFSRTERGWRVSRMKFVMTWSRGNANLISIAQEKAKKKNRG